MCKFFCFTCIHTYILYFAFSLLPCSHCSLKHNNQKSGSHYKASELIPCIFVCMLRVQWLRLVFFSSLAFLSSSVSIAYLSRLSATIFSSLTFFSSSISMANLSCLVAASFSSRALFSSSVSTANLSYLLAITGDHHLQS